MTCCWFCSTHDECTFAVLASRWIEPERFLEILQALVFSDFWQHSFAFVVFFQRGYKRHNLNAFKVRNTVDKR